MSRLATLGARTIITVGNAMPIGAVQSFVSTPGSPRSLVVPDISNPGESPCSTGDSGSRPPSDWAPRASIPPGCACLRSRVSSGAFRSLSSYSLPRHPYRRHRDAGLAGTEEIHTEEIHNECDLSVDGLLEQGRQVVGSGSVAIVDIRSVRVGAYANRSSGTGPVRTSSAERLTTRCTAQGRSPDSRPRCTLRGWRARVSGPA